MATFIYSDFIPCSGYKKRENAFAVSGLTLLCVEKSAWKAYENGSLGKIFLKNLHSCQMRAARGGGAIMGEMMK
jgi:hypothetical protein